jgi:hypothetical protein
MGSITLRSVPKISLRLLSSELWRIHTWAATLDLHLISILKMNSGQEAPIKRKLYSFSVGRWLNSIQRGSSTVHPKAIQMSVMQFGETVS